MRVREAGPDDAANSIETDEGLAASADQEASREPDDLLSLEQLRALLVDATQREMDEEADEPVIADATDSIEELVIEEDDTDDDEDDALEQARMLRITRMPPSVAINEAHVGRAFGQWVMEVRCECGRRWFEVEAVYQARCPRCGKLVFIEFEPDES